MNERGRENLSLRAARWSAAHWKTATFGWLAFVAAVFLLGTAVGTKPLLDDEAGNGESGRAQKTLAHSNFKEPAGESVLIQNRKLIATDDAFRATINAVVARVSKLPQVMNVRSPLGSAITNQGQISQDGHSALVQFDIRGKAEDAEDKIDPVLSAVGGLQKAYPGFVIEEFGDASGNKTLSKIIDADFNRAEYSSVPITFLILLIAFGALMAAGVPVLLAFSAVLAALGLSALLSHALAASDATKIVILLVGMAVGVDYSLFYLKREREERAGGRDAHDALLRAAATSGEAVLISGATVLIAVAGMLLSGDKTFESIGAGTMIVVALGIVGSLTVLPALMYKLGDRVEKGRIPLVHRLRGSSQESRFWGAVLTPVLRRPLVSATLAAAGLVALTIPAFQLETKFPSVTDLPRSIAIAKTYDRVNEAFPGSPVPAIVVVKAPDARSVAVRQGILDMRDAAVATGRFTLPADIVVNPAHTVARVSMPIKTTKSRSKTAYAAIQSLRDDIIPATLGQVPGVSADVAGETAANRDFNDLMRVRMPVVFAFVLGLAFLLMLITFRSIVIPIKTIVLNLLSVGASYGMLVLVFQHRWAEGILDFRSNGGIASWLPLFLFVLLFGLSMDYHVFILTRVKELVARGLSTEEAVTRAIRMTAGTVTAAAIVMVAVFSLFATLRIPDVKQAGFGLAFAVLIDATVIRGVLLPATMKLLGDWNWYLPRWLEWVPSIEGELEPPPEAPPALAP
jgi:RND superfamily putative drug exporter